MAGIDASIYSQLKAPDIMGAAQEGIKARDMIKASQAQDAIKKAYQAGVVQNPDGTTSYDSGRTAAELLKGGHVKEAQEIERQGMADQTAKLENKMKMIGHIAQVTTGVKDQASYDSALSQAKSLGLDISSVPAVYDPKVIDGIRQKALSLQQQMEQANKDRDFELREKESNTRMKELGEEKEWRRKVEDRAFDEKEQGLATPYGKANTVDDAKQLKSAHELKKQFDSRIDDMIALREKHKGGALLNRDDVGRGKQLSKDLLLDYKELAKLGVLSQADEAILNAIIPADPLEYNSPFAAATGQDPILHKLKSFKADKDKDFQNRVATRTRAGLAASSAGNTTPNQKDQQAIAWAQANPGDPRAAKILEANGVKMQAGGR